MPPRFAAPSCLQDFQRAFGRRIRNPRAPLPAGVARRRMAAYEELLFNNLRSFLDRCFPVGHACLGEARWQRLCRAFFRDWPCRSALFHEIPREFLAYLTSAPGRRLPRWFGELARYEWAELAVALSDAALPPGTAEGDLFDGCPRVNPSLMLLDCQWPVHEISPQNRPHRASPVHLAVFRDDGDTVRFARLTPATAHLLALLQTDRLSGREAVTRLLHAHRHPPCDTFFSFGRQCLDALQAQGLLCGVHDAS